MMQKDVADVNASSDTATGSAEDVQHADSSSGSHWRRPCTLLMSFCRRTRHRLRCTSSQRRVVAGLVLMSIVAVAFVALTASLASALTATSQFNAPLFTVNVATFLTIFLYPLHIAYRYVLQRGKLSVRDAFR